jgi:CubicO group peptidase (beta-lactamase class C family)
MSSTTTANRMPCQECHPIPSLAKAIHIVSTFVCALPVALGCGGTKAPVSDATIAPDAGAHDANKGSGGTTGTAGALVSRLGDPAYPDDFWVATTPAESDVDVTALQKAVETIASSKLEIHAFLVARRGRMVFEQYGWTTGSNGDDPDKTSHQIEPDERHPVHSTTKSFLSTLVGMAIGDGLLPGVDDLVVPHFPEYQPLPEPSPDKDAITLADLLTMRSGLKFVGAVDDNASAGWPDPAQVMLSRPVVDTPVGEVWNYSSGGSDVIAALLRKATGQTPLAYANEKLFGPLGLASNVPWEASSNGTNHGGWGLALTPRELARFGELYRNRGLWKGRQIVPAEWTDVATSPKCQTPWNGQYGYHFWIPNLPGFFGTRGAYGQNIYVSRELGLVVVFTSDLPVSTADGVLDSLMRTSVIPAVKATGRDAGGTVPATVTLEVEDLGAVSEGQSVHVGLLAGAADCMAGGEMVYVGSGVVMDGTCRIDLGPIEKGLYTACAFLDADDDAQPGPGDRAGMVPWVVTGDEVKKWSTTDWITL